MKITLDQIFGQVSTGQMELDISQNGDDAIELFFYSEVIDIFGDIDTDGTGQIWEYQDAWAVRDAQYRFPTTTFNVTEWEIAELNCSDGSDNNSSSFCPFPYWEVSNLECPFTEYTITVGGGTYPSEISWEIININLDVVASGGAPITIENDVTVRLADGSYGILMYDSFGDGWNGNVIQLWTLDLDGTPTEELESTIQTGSFNVAQLNVGPGNFDNLVGCTDPIATNVDPTAIWNDGSCSYDGVLCEYALAAINGSNEAASAPVWYSFTASVDGEVTISSENGGVDTQVYGYSGTCDNLIQVGYADDNVPMGDGLNSYASEMIFPISNGETYYIYWTDYWSSDGFI